MSSIALTGELGWLLWEYFPLPLKRLLIVAALPTILLADLLLMGIERGTRLRAPRSQYMAILLALATSAALSFYFWSGVVVVVVVVVVVTDIASLDASSHPIASFKLDLRFSLLSSLRVLLLSSISFFLSISVVFASILRLLAVCAIQSPLATAISTAILCACVLL